MDTQTDRKADRTDWLSTQASRRSVSGQREGPEAQGDNLPLIIASARTAVAAGVSELAKMMTTTTLARTKVDLQRKELI